MKKYIYIIFTVVAMLSSCSMDEVPQAQISKDVTFSSENGLKMYSYSFYNMLPSITNAYRKDAMCDYGAVGTIDNFLQKDSYSAAITSGWSWSELRNINYFIANCNQPEVDEKTNNNYIGIARFFRALFYYDMVVRYGDVPWIDKPLQVEDEELYAPRDSRETVMSNVLADLNFACENILATEGDGSIITKGVAYGLKSRICLFEGTFRKYHTELGLTSSVDTWLNEATNAAQYVMDSGAYSINTKEGPAASLRALFISDKPVQNEVMLASCASQELGILGDANWWWTSSTYGLRFSMTRTFMNTFLNLDGTPYTNDAAYATMGFYDECQNRDMRMAQTIRTPGYKRDGIMTPPDFQGNTYTGYQPIKYCLDATSFDDGRLNTNAIPLMRYAEILLNYAEAKTELGTLTNDDWTKTVGTLRARAGITNGLTAKPTTIDTYLQQTYFPAISDPTLLEVRRERSIELALEGFRYTDLLRWKKGELMTQKWRGIYVNALNTPMDLDHDGTLDVVFYQGTKPDNIPSTCAAVDVSVSETNQQGLSEGDHGYLTWSDNLPRYWYPDNRQYYYPIPSLVIVKNPQLEQNPGWK